MTVMLWVPRDSVPAPDCPAPPAASLALVGRAAAAGVVAAVLVPGQRFGVGTVVAALALALAVPPGARLRTPTGAALAAVAVALAGVAVLRDAGWVVGTCLVAAFAAWSLLFGGGPDWRATALGLVAVPRRWVPAVAWLTRPLAGLASPERRRVGLPAVRGAAVAMVLLAVFGGLFATADPAFRGLLEHLALPAPSSLLTGRLCVLVAAATLVGAAALVAAAPADRPAPASYAGRVLRPVEWVLPLLVLDLLFAAFVSVQLTVLFGGRDHVLATAGLTYAEYARQGFGQLVVAAVLTLVVIAWAVRVVPRSPGTDRLRKALLGVLCVLTLVVLASASRRLGLYEQEYGFTRLRVSVDAAIAWLAVVLLLVLAAGSCTRPTWLPTAVVLAAAVGLLVFAAGDPDARIAQRNVERFAATGDLDVGYLAGLSADAVPALQQLPELQRSCLLAALRPETEPWYAVNLARARARDALREPPATTCPPLLRTRGTR